MNGYKINNALGGVSYTVTFTRTPSANPAFKGHRLAKVRVGCGMNCYALLAEYDPIGGHALLSDRDLDVLDRVLSEAAASVEERDDLEKAYALISFARARLYELSAVHRC